MGSGYLFPVADSRSVCEPFEEYCYANGVTSISDFLVYTLVHDLPDEPHGTLAAELQQQILKGRNATDLSRLHPTCNVFCQELRATCPASTQSEHHGPCNEASNADLQKKCGVARQPPFTTAPFLSHQRLQLASLKCISRECRERSSTNGVYFSGGGPSKSGENGFSPAIRSYLQLHRIGAVIEEWLTAVNRCRPTDTLRFTQKYFAQLYRAKVLLANGCEKEKLSYALGSAPSKISGNVDKSSMVAARASEGMKVADDDDLPNISRGYTPHRSPVTFTDTTIKEFEEASGTAQ